MELMFILSITAAEKNIRLATPYFIVDNVTMQALTDARKRGVKVQIIVPGADQERPRWGMPFDMLTAVLPSKSAR
jgi:cardiolipin synthase